MNAGRNTIGNKKMTREDYKAVKKMDRQQFETFCRSLYEQGQQSARENGITRDQIREAILSVKGIGQKRAEEIMQAIEQKLGEKK